MFGFLARSKPLKIRRLDGDRKYGVAVKNVKELLKRGCELLQLSPLGAHICLYEDGTKVTEQFFPSLADNTELVLLSRDQTWGGAVCDIGRLLDTDRYAASLVEAATGLLSDERSPKTRKILTDLLHNLNDRSEWEKSHEDKDWFEGIETRFRTKSSYMRHNCENRIRGYLREVVEASKSLEKAKDKAEYLKASQYLTEMLKSARYNGCYFDRTVEEVDRLCTQEGWFTCQGSFDQNACASLHSINPYSSRESRIIFSTWNLDHRIEKKRTVIPALVKALQNKKCTDINLNYFYSLLFTRENLKLVHIVCHKKEAHTLQCDSKKIYKRSTKKDEEEPKYQLKRKRNVNV